MKPLFLIGFAVTTLSIAQELKFPKVTVAKINPHLEAVLGEAGGNPDESFKSTILDFDQVISAEERIEFYKRMALPRDILNMFKLIEAKHPYSNQAPAIGINHSIAYYDLVNGVKVKYIYVDPRKDNVRFAETPYPGAILWYPAGINRPKEEIFLTYLHELVRSSYTKTNLNRELDSPAATFFVNSLDAHFRTLLLSADQSARINAYKKLEAEFEVLTLSDFINAQVRSQLSAKVNNRDYVFPELRINGRSASVQFSGLSIRGYADAYSGTQFGAYPMSKSLLMKMQETLSPSDYYLAAQVHHLFWRSHFDAILTDVYGLSKNQRNCFMNVNRKIIEISFEESGLAKPQLNAGEESGDWVIRDYSSPERTQSFLPNGKNSHQGREPFGGIITSINFGKVMYSDSNLIGFQWSDALSGQPYPYQSAFYWGNKRNGLVLNSHSQSNGNGLAPEETAFLRCERAESLLREVRSMTDFTRVAGVFYEEASQ